MSEDHIIPMFTFANVAEALEQRRKHTHEQVVVRQRLAELRARAAVAPLSATDRHSLFQLKAEDGRLNNALRAISQWLADKPPQVGSGEILFEYHKMVLNLIGDEFESIDDLLPEERAMVQKVQAFLDSAPPHIQAARQKAG